MFDVIHMDEKWFNLYTASTKYYISPAEAIPYRTSANKRYIGKIMFLAAVARPRYDFHRKRHFDGRIGIWPIIDIVLAKRSSVNRLAGTPEIKGVSMDGDKYKQLLQSVVFPAIRMLWPGMHCIMLC